MGIKKLIISEQMPDKNDPQYKERYEKDVEAGKKFAKAIKLDKGASAIQRFANNNRNMFLAIVFLFVLVSVALNIFRMTRAYSSFHGKSVAVERQEQALQDSHHNGRSIELSQIKP